MKLLLDQNISFRVTGLVKNAFEQVAQVEQLGLENASDYTIWQYARENNFTIITFDSDFIDLVNLRGTPPKVI